MIIFDNVERLLCEPLPLTLSGVSDKNFGQNRQIWKILNVWLPKLYILHQHVGTPTTCSLGREYPWLLEVLTRFITPLSSCSEVTVPALGGPWAADK